MKNIWSGTISFGLIHIPVKLHSASKNRRLEFDCAKFRKKTIEQVSSEDIIKDHELGKGESAVLAALNEKFLQFALKNGLKGIAADHTLNPHKRGVRSHLWLKINAARRQKAAIGHFIASKRSRGGLEALIFGVYNNNTDLRYINRTGGRFAKSKLREMRKKISSLIAKSSPLKNEFKTEALPVRVKPKPITEIKFSDWTKDDHVRQPIFFKLRESKNPVKKETAQSAPDANRDAPVSEKIYKNPNLRNGKELAINGHKITISNPDKIFWPDEGYVKKDIIGYYRKISPIILKYLRDRPETLNRFPDGMKETGFYQKDVDFPVPDWIETTAIYSEAENKTINYLLCQNEETLVYLANLGYIEMNPWLSRVRDIDFPDYAVLNLDPTNISFQKTFETANVARKILEKSGIKSFVKTSGAAGLHIYIPLRVRYVYDQSRNFAKLIATLINNELPGITSIESRPDRRKGKVYVDYQQNRRGQTMICAYSLRPKEGALVSTPLEWEEVNPKLNPAKFNMKNIFNRIGKKGDFWEDLIKNPGNSIETALIEMEKNNLISGY